MEISTFSLGMAPLVSNSVVAIGVFDGVHLAHRALLKRAKEEADKRRIPLYVFTFLSECPTAKSAPPLYATDEKCRLLEQNGCDGVLLSPFSIVSDFSADRFVREILCGTLGCSLAVCGYNFRFGVGASANAETLADIMQKAGGGSLTVPPFLSEDKPLSTTRIREMLAAGETKRAGDALGLPYHLTGKVEHGLRLGHSLGIPTLNLSVHEGLFTPKIGVYAATCQIGGEQIPSLVNFGTCPTFGARNLHAEAHLLTPIADSYGEDVTIFFHRYLREERKFENKEALLAQIQNDIKQVKETI